MTPEQIAQISEFVKAIGLGGLGIYALIKMLDFMRWFMTGEFEQRGNLAKALASLNSNQIEHDKQLDAIMDTQLVTADGLKDQNKLLSDQNTLLDGVNSGVSSLATETHLTGDRMQTLHEGIVGGLNDHSTAITTIGDNLEKKIGTTAEAIVAKLDDVHLDVKAVPQNVIDIIDWDMVIDRIKSAVGPMVAEALSDCLKLTAEQAKELDHADKVIDNIVKPPDPTDPPDHAVPVPTEPPSVVVGQFVPRDLDLPKASGE